MVGWKEESVGIESTNKSSLQGQQDRLFVISRSIDSQTSRHLDI